MARSKLLQLERTLHHATRFVEEMRADLAWAARDGADLPPRIRSVHDTPGHSTPEFRTLNIPVPGTAAGLPVDALSGAIACYAARKRPDRLLLAMEAEMDGAPVLIAEARDRAGGRLFWIQPFARSAGEITWGEPLNGGWTDPASQEMILDASFAETPSSVPEVHAVPTPPEIVAR